MENENAIRIRNFLIIMILIMIIYIILATIYSFIITSNVFTLNTPPPVYKFGDVINNTSDIITNTIKNIVEIMNGSIHMIGYLLNEFATPYKTTTPALPYVTTLATQSTESTESTESSGFQKTKENIANLDEAINTSSFPINIPEANDTTSPIQMTSSNTKWCYIGNFGGERGCAKIEEYEKCPGPVFYDKNTCVSPENSANHFLKSKNNPKRRTLE